MPYRSKDLQPDLSYCSMWRVEIGLHLTFSAKFNQQLSWIESKQARLQRGFESNQRKNQSFTEWLNFTQSILAPWLFSAHSCIHSDRKEHFLGQKRKWNHNLESPAQKWNVLHCSIIIMKKPHANLINSSKINWQQKRKVFTTANSQTLMKNIFA